MSWLQPVWKRAKIEYLPEPCHLGALLEEVASNFRELNPDWTITTDLAALSNQVNVDPMLFRQVFGNLISNAVKYSPCGKTVAIRGWLTASGDVMISVADQGAGIPKEELGKLFERFFRASTSSAFPAPA